MEMDICFPTDLTFHVVENILLIHFQRENSRKSREVRQYGPLQPGNKRLRSKSLNSKYCLFSLSDYQGHDAGWWQGKRKKE